MKLAILLTATVRPQVRGGNFSAEERMGMYTSTLRYYAQAIGTSRPIVVVENSDADLSAWKREFKDTLRLEIIQFTPPENDKTKANSQECEQFNTSKGKGYNEFLMIKKATEQSETLRQSTHFMKITGRYPMLNIPEMATEAERRGKDKVFLGDVKDTRLYDLLRLKRDGHWGDSRFFVADVAYWRKHLADCYRWMDDNVYGRYAEDWVLQLSRQHRTDRRFSFRFRHQVQFGGRSGAAGYHEDYGSWKKRLSNKVRRLMRLLLPWLWT